MRGEQSLVLSYYRPCNMTDCRYCNMGICQRKCSEYSELCYKMVAADLIPDDLQERTVRDMIGRACADALYEIRHKPDVETVQSLIQENERKMRADKEFNVLNVMRLALTIKMYMVYMNTLNVDTCVHLYRDDCGDMQDMEDTEEENGDEMKTRV